MRVYDVQCLDQERGHRGIHDNFFMVVAEGEGEADTIPITVADGRSGWRRGSGEEKNAILAEQSFGWPGGRRWEYRLNLESWRRQHGDCISEKLAGVN